MEEKIKKLNNKLKVLDEQRRRDRKRLVEVGKHARKIYNITSQIKELEEIK